MTKSTESAQLTDSGTRPDDGSDEQSERLVGQSAGDRAAGAHTAEPTPPSPAASETAEPTVARPASSDQTAEPTQPSRAPSDQQLPPGASVDDPVAALWGADLVERYREQWRTLQMQFVDDPHTATEQAAELVNDAVQSLTNALATQKQTLDGWQSANRSDTEILRVALQRYRDFLDRLLGM